MATRHAFTINFPINTGTLSNFLKVAGVSVITIRGSQFDDSPNTPSFASAVIIDAELTPSQIQSIVNVHKSYTYTGPPAVVIPTTTQIDDALNADTTDANQIHQV